MAEMTLEEAVKIAYHECLVCGSTEGVETVSYGMSEGYALNACPEHVDDLDYSSERYSRLIVAHTVIINHCHEVFMTWLDGHVDAELLPVWDS